jgi:ATP-dependent DNA helicase RecG
MLLKDSVENLPKIKKPLIAALKKLGITTVENLLWHLPYRYLDFSKTKTINQLQAGENITLKVKIKTISSRFSFHGRMSLAEAVVSDETGSLKVTWFNQSYLAKSLVTGEEIYLAGKPDYYNGKLQLTNPVYEKISDFNIHTARLVPLYHLKKDIYPKTIRNLIASVLELSNEIPETLPSEILDSQNLLPISETIKQSHFPDTLETFEQAKKRLAFEEIFLNQLLAQKHKIQLAKKKAYSAKFNKEIVDKFLSRLPFSLTAGQKKASWEILQDLEKNIPMNRLLEGDVGSGKTLVAFLSAIELISQGFQVALLTPTEILAKQHAQTAEKYLLNPEPLNFNTRCILISQNYSQINGKDKDRKTLLNMLKEGQPGLYIGTHALLQKTVKFKNLSLVIIDEQHRFGVQQRANLLDTKGKAPHLLSLSATPIPRSLQLAFFGELEISQIKTKPAERKPILSRLVLEHERNEAYKFIEEEIKKGRQAFVITPLIEESEKNEIKSVKTEVENIQNIFPQFKIGLMHGKLKSAEKEKVMQEFLENKIQILVSTSVVEVGVDVPNASVMVIEGAERFGLSQLHQFRGRVGRSSHQSYCLLFQTQKNFPSPSPLVGEGRGEGINTSLARLETFVKTQDGFLLAEADLKQRGFGELYGESQSGVNFKYFDPSYTSLIQPARTEALKILEKDFSLKNYPYLKEQIKNKTIHFE